MSNDVVESPLSASPVLEPDSIVVEAAEVNTHGNKKKDIWTEEKRAALSVKMKAKHQPSVFALSDDHEFPTSPTKPLPVDFINGQGTVSNLSFDGLIAVPPALPGTPLSPYRRCPCLAVLPGRVCTFCYGTHWTKLCQKCEGEGRIHLSVRKGAERSQPCGHCGGRGTLPANMREISEATRLAEEFAAGPAGRSLIVAVEAPEFRRAVKLPGIGVTATKRTGTISARKRERLRNETRKQQRNGTRTVATT